MEIKKIEKVESKPEVNIFLRKPYISDQNKDNQQPGDQGFQNMLDNSIDKLKKEGQSFDDTVNKIIEDTYDEEPEEQLLTTRELHILELKKARRQFETVQSFRQDVDQKGPRLRH